MRVLVPVLIPALVTACSGAALITDRALETNLNEIVNAALRAGPWDSDPAGWGSACTADSPCDTLFVDPRIARLPPGNWFVGPPGLRPVLGLLQLDVSADAQDGRPMLLRDTRVCHDQFYVDTLLAPRRAACISLGIDESGIQGHRIADTVVVQFLVESPANGQMWPRVQAVRTGAGWRARLIGNHGV